MTATLPDWAQWLQLGLSAFLVVIIVVRQERSMSLPARPDTVEDNEFVLRSVHAVDRMPAPPWTVWEVIGTVFAGAFMLGCFSVVAEMAVKIMGDH